MDDGFTVDPVALTRAHELLRGGAGTVDELGQRAPVTPSGGDRTGQLAHLLAALSGAAARYSADLDSMAGHLRTAREHYSGRDEATALELRADEVE